MTQSTSGGTQNQQAAKPATATEADAAAAGNKDDQSNHDHMSRDKAGGAKQEQKHN